MPVIKKGNAALRIDLAAPEAWTFAPGDTVIGDVVRCSSIVTSNADLKVYLRGRIQTTRTSLSNGNRYAADTKHHTYQAAVASEQILLAKRYPVFEGPLNIPDGGDPVSWSFTTEITPDPPRTMYGNIDIFYDYLPGSTLPGSAGSVAWIEYYLEAELRYREEGHYGEKMITALQPITLRHRPLHEFQEFGIAHQIINRKVRSHHLLPEYRSSALTMKQKAQHKFGSSKVPELHFQVEVFLPNTIQLDNPSFLPLNLIVLQQNHTSNEIRDVQRKAWINSIKLSIDTFTIVKNHGASLEAGFSQATNSATSFPSKFVGSSSVSQDLYLEKAAQDTNLFPLELVVSDNPIDIGSILQLVLHSDGLSMRGTRLQQVLPITPSLDVYNIRYLNWLKMELSLTMANERFNLGIRIPVKILAAE
ncbi:hypothetical protein N7528_009332 [Penicillium herquei]|nr:hypothetical protein N7528_009332 [Penicillium herquei]